MKTEYNNNIIQSLWVGETLSNVELLTLHSFVSFGHTFHLYAYNDIKNSLPVGVIIKDANLIIPKEKIFSYKRTNQFGHGKGSLGGFSDIFRYKLLYEVGGWWVDMDVTCLGPFSFKEEFVFRTHQSLKVVGNIMKCPKHSELMKICFEKAQASINEENRDWHKPIQILNETIENLCLEKYIQDISNPDSWKIIRKMISSDLSIPKNWIAIHWVNEEWRRNKLNKNYFKENSVLGKLMMKYNIKKEPIPFNELIVQIIHQTYIYAVYKQIPSIIKRKLL